MITDAILMLQAELEMEGALVNFTTHDINNMAPRLKIICDKQTYDVLTRQLEGILHDQNNNFDVKNASKCKGLGVSFEIGNVNI